MNKAHSIDKVIIEVTLLKNNMKVGWHYIFANFDFGQ